MSVKATLPRSGTGLVDTINRFLASLLENGVVDALLVPVELPSGRNVIQSLVRDPAKLERAVPVSPVMPVNSATVVSNLTIDQGTGRLGAVLRSCEIRALVELAKLKQASLDSVRIIGVDCLGSFTVADYAAMVEAGRGLTAADLVDRALEDEGFRGEHFSVRTACRICERPLPEYGDILIGFLGLSPEAPLVVELNGAVGEMGLERLGLEADDPQDRVPALRRLVEQRVAARDAAFAEVRKATGTPEGLVDYFAACLTCHNCSVTCPICYCKQCVFTTQTFEHSSSQYMRRSARKGALRMPADTVLYQLTRMNHMATSCVGCGQCESGCPSHIPLTALFRSVGQKVQALYDYVPGRNLSEEPPVTTFREDELGSVAR
jgi:formate dehydrogenase subunit beta